jgi:hypothetical protein
MLRFLVLAIIVPGNITKRGTGLVGGLGWKDESADRAPAGLKALCLSFL